MLRVGGQIQDFSSSLPATHPSLLFIHTQPKASGEEDGCGSGGTPPHLRVFVPSPAQTLLRPEEMKQPANTVNESLCGWLWPGLLGLVPESTAASLGGEETESHHPRTSPRQKLALQGLLQRLNIQCHNRCYFQLPGRFLLPSFSNTFNSLSSGSCSSFLKKPRPV